MILGSDWDGTIRLNQTVVQRDIDSINEFRKNNKFGVVTGRTVNMIKPELEKYHVGYDFLIASNGTIICDKDLNVIKRYDLDTKETLQLLKYLENLDVSFCLSDGYQFGYYKLSEKAAMFVKNFNNLPYEEMLKRAYNGIFVNHTDIEVLRSIKKYIETNYHMKASLNCNNLDIYSSATSKANGLKIIGEHYHDNQIHAIGDGENDVEMIEAYGNLAMKICMDEVKEVAKVYFDNISECIKYIEGK